MTTPVEPSIGSPEFHSLRTPIELQKMSGFWAIEKSRIHPGSSTSSLEEIANRLHMQSVMPHIQQECIKLGITVPNTISDRRKADILTLIASSMVLENNPENPENITAAAISLATQMPTEMFLKSLRATSIRQDSSLGLQEDVTKAMHVGGHRLSSGIEAGHIDRLLGTCVTHVCQELSLSPQQALEVAQAVILNKTPSTIEVASVIPKVRMLFDIAQVITERIPKTGLKQQDVPFSPITEVASRLLKQAELLQNPTEKSAMVKKSIELGPIQPEINSLTDILTIVDNTPEIRAVSFDMYDTLVQWTSDQTERRKHFAHAAYINLKEKGISISEQEVQHIMDASWNNRWEKFQAQGIELPLEMTLDDMTAQLEHKGALPKGTEPIEKRREQVSRMLLKLWYDEELQTAVRMPGAKETLEQLHARGIKICITSNASWSRKHIDHVLHKFGLRHLIDSVTISSEDTAKPAAIAEQEAFEDFSPSRTTHRETRKMKKPNQTEFFHYAWDKIGVPYNAILHVGDNPWDDFQGAQNAGAHSTLYNNPLAYKRLESDGKFRENPTLYAQTAVAMEKDALDLDFITWVQNEMKRMHIPEKERARVEQMAHELYKRSRDIFAPTYIATAEEVLTRIEKGQVDQVLCLARDGLPLAVTAKLLLRFEQDRFPSVVPEQIKFVHTSRSLLKKVSGVDEPLDTELKKHYIAYLVQKGIIEPGKRVLLTDLICGSGLTHICLSKLLETQGVIPSGYYLCSHQPEIEGFLQNAMQDKSQFLQSNTMLLFFESLLNGPKQTVKEYELRNTRYGASVVPKVLPKEPSTEVLTRGLSKESILFFNHVATKGLIDGVRMHNRKRLAGIAPETPKEIASRFINFIVNTPTDDLRRSMPWEDHGQWYLPSQNDLETSL